MSSQSTINQRPYHNHAPSSRLSKTVEIHRPSRESIQEYQALLNEASKHAAAAANYQDPFVPSRQAPPPPSSGSPSSKGTSTPPRVRNSLVKPHPSRKPSLPSGSPKVPIDHDPFAANSNGSSTMMSGTAPPPRPSRANTSNLHDIYSIPNHQAHHRLSDPVSLPPEAALYANYTDQPVAAPLPLPPPPPPPPPPMSMADTSTINSIPTIHTTISGLGTNRSRSSTAAKSKKGMFNFMSDFLNTSKRPEISTPYDPVHLTHVGFNSSTGEFTGLPKEWQQLLQESGISKQDQEKNPQAVMEIVKFYQEGRGDTSVWDKMGAIAAPQAQSSGKGFQEEGFQNPVSLHCIRTLHESFILNDYSALPHLRPRRPSHNHHPLQQLDTALRPHPRNQPLQLSIGRPHSDFLKAHTSQRALSSLRGLIRLVIGARLVLDSNLMVNTELVTYHLPHLAIPHRSPSHHLVTLQRTFLPKASRGRIPLNRLVLLLLACRRLLLLEGPPHDEGKRRTRIKKPTLSRGSSKSVLMRIPQDSIVTWLKSVPGASSSLGVF